ncbi:hypothetical protein CK203_106167 [Vitis vinifera]|uniref:Retrotransposon gag domain-containing protein n=1 Tax=Vitis vinifera TaxID=29760 RepID=A0A438CCY1_VITVI|nr:hypothetical protein CK203_106167 [Vitis vinifera]
MYIRGRGKMGYLTGEKKAPAVDDPNYAIWDAENSMVMTWLVNSMEEDISSNYMCYPTTQELWENVNQMYSDLGNQSQIFELTLKLGEIRQGEDNVTKYFNSLKRIWQDLDLFNTMSGNLPRMDFIIRRPWKTIGSSSSWLALMSSLMRFSLGYHGGGYNKVAAFQRKSDERPRFGVIFATNLAILVRTVGKSMGNLQIGKEKGDKPGRAIIPTANEAETSPFTTEQMEHLLAL